MKNNQTKPQKTKIKKMDIAKRLLAGCLAILMLTATMSTFIYYIVI